jgi:hypothetical protein
MADVLTQYRDTSFPLRTLVAEIERGAIALPDIQRPFVWHNTQVRNLFDSIYRGFPIGQVMFWETGADADTRRIGLDGKVASPRLVIVDGQQRLTAAFAVMTGTSVMDEKYRERDLRLAFRPRDARFDVPSAATANDPEYLPDITAVFGGTATRRITNEFLERLEKARGGLATEESDRLADAIDRLSMLGQFPIQAVELNADIDEESVAEVFVRINSQGTALDQADFLLTLMSVWSPQGRKELELFAQSAVTPPASASQKTPFNYHLRPGPDELVRVVVASAFGRGRLKAAYQVLRGKNAETGEASTEQREANFARMAEAQKGVLDLHNWHEFLHSLDSAGFRSDRQLSSKFAVLVSYALWLEGRQRGVENRPRQNVIARWFFMAQVTGRYSGSPESQFEQDLRLVAEAKGADGWLDALDEVLQREMSEDFFRNRLASILDARSWRNLGLLAYEASLVLLDAPMLFSPTDETVASRLDPKVVTVRGVERHHLFPKNWVRTSFGVSGHALNGLADRPANASWVDWIENNEISDLPPAEYYEEHADRLTSEQLERQIELHALPEGWHLMEYEKFLGERRALMAGVIAQGYDRLRSRSQRR